MVVEQTFGFGLLGHSIGVPITGPTRVLADTVTVVQSSTKFTPPTNKEHLSVAYHRCRESVTVGAVSFAHVGSEDDPADLLTIAMNDATTKRFLEKFGMSRDVLPIHF